MKKVSIIIPVYNERNTILQTLKVVSTQLIKGWIKEIVVVDDFSTDGTREMLKSRE